MIWLDKGGWPMTYFKNRPITNFIRWLLHASIVKSIMWRGRWAYSAPGELQYVAPGIPSVDTPLVDADNRCEE